MNFDLIAQWLARLSFREAVWLFPVAFTLHVLEELPQFTAWAKRYVTASYKRRGYLKIHLAGIIGAFLAAAVLWYFPNRIIVFIFFTFVFTPGIFFNTLFHAGATAYFGAYCPGLLTALMLYLPLYGFVSTLAYREGLLGNEIGLLSFIIAGIFHTAEVGRNVFKAW
jgi:uncharacterized membrane protein YeaQ/YmgE (transglycosylase-associated protein family)